MASYPIPSSWLGLSFMVWVIGLRRENGKENGNYRDYRGYIGGIYGLYVDNGTENGNNYII